MPISQQGHSDARRFRQWEEVGRRVRRGERAFYILGSCTVSAKQEDPEPGIDLGDPIPIGFRAMPIFSFRQTAGERRCFGFRPLVAVMRSMDLDLRIADADTAGPASFIHTDTFGQQLNQINHLGPMS